MVFSFLGWMTVLMVAAMALPVVAMAEGADGCVACHGASGISDKPGIPNLAGLNKGYLTTTLTNYLSGSRATAVKEHGENITPELLASLAAQYSALPWEYAKGNTIDAAKAAAGEKASTRCRLCHEDNGRSQEDDMPRLAGQKLDYMIERMQAIKANPAKNPMPSKMMTIVKEMTDADMEAVNHFFAAQK